MKSPTRIVTVAKLLRKKPPVESSDATTAALFEAFLDWSGRHNEPPTDEFYRVHLPSFVDLHGAVLLRELKPDHVTRSLDSHPSWSQARAAAPSPPSSEP